MPDYQCPKCDQIWFAKADRNLNCANFACNNEPLKRSKVRNIKAPRKLLKAATSRLDEIKRRRDAKISTLRQRRIVDYKEPEVSRDDDDYEETKEALASVEITELLREAEDTDFVPTAERWEFSQRLTSANMVARARPLNPCQLIKQQTKTIAAQIAGERAKNCGIAIGFTMGVRSISAWAIGNQVQLPIGTKWFAGNKDTAEWCHLVGVSLGGQTIPENLVSASYSANTFMGVIEKFIQARTDLAVTVEVEAALPSLVGRPGNLLHIADWIIYKISSVLRSGSSLAQFDIDARITAFSRDDAQRVEDELNRVIPKKS